MTYVDTLENKLSSVQKYLKILDGFKKFSKTKIQSNLTLKGAVERYLYLAIQASIELAEAVIALKKFRKPTTYSENFSILQEEKLIPAPLTEKLIKMVGFRNVIAHDYEKIDPEIFHDVLTNKTKDINKFIHTIKSKLKIK